MVIKTRGAHSTFAHLTCKVTCEVNLSKSVVVVQFMSFIHFVGILILSIDYWYE